MKWAVGRGSRREEELEAEESNVDKKKRKEGEPYTSFDSASQLL